MRSGYSPTTILSKIYDLLVIEDGNPLNSITKQTRFITPEKNDKPHISIGTESFWNPIEQLRIVYCKSNTVVIITNTTVINKKNKALCKRKKKCCTCTCKHWNVFQSHIPNKSPIWENPLQITYCLRPELSKNRVCDERERVSKPFRVIVYL